MSTRSRNPAVVLNCETAGVGVIHALGAAQVEMISVERRWPPTLGRFSRFVRQRILYRQGDSIVDTLLQLGDQFDGKGVLFPSTDADLEALIVAHDELSQRYHVPAAPHLGLRIFQKNWQYDLAERTGVPLPRCVRFTAGNVPDLHGFHFPLIIKPSARVDSAGERVFRLRLLDDDRALGTTLEEIAREFDGRDFQIAENIPGEPDQLYTIGSYSDAEGRVLRSYSGRKVTQYPYYHGMASVSESLTLPHEVFEQARALLDEARFHGISQVEFKYDPRDGKYKLLEINGRSWLWVKLSACSGVNLPLIQHYDLTADARLGAALAVPQNDACFFVYDHHVKLNAMASERERIRQLKRQKRMVSAIDEPGDWKLSAAHRVISFVKRARQGRAASVATVRVRATAPKATPRVAQERS